MATRTDRHAPSNFLPEEYDYVFSFSYAGADEPSWNVDHLIAFRRENRFFQKERETGGCDLCGAHFRHGDVWVHVPTGEHIVLGHICADKVGLFADRSEWVQGRAAARAEGLRTRERRQQRVDLRELLQRDPGLRPLLRMDHPIARDIRSRLLARPASGVSEKQRALLEKLAREAAEKREEILVPAPTGRQEFEGRLVSLKLHDSAYGSTWKATVKVETEAGAWLAWGTLPDRAWDEVRSLPCPEEGYVSFLRGATIRLRANLTAGRDPHFAIAKRPILLGITPNTEAIRAHIRGEIQRYRDAGHAFQRGLARAGLAREIRAMRAQVLALG